MIPPMSTARRAQGCEPVHCLAMTDSPEARRAASYALLILTFINLFNYLDRWVLSAVLESIKKELHFSDAMFGFIATGFIVVYMLTSPVFGALGDHRKRPPLIALGW